MAVNSLKFQPQITSLLNDWQKKDPRLYDLLHAMIDQSDGVATVVNRIASATGGIAALTDSFDVEKRVSLRI